MLLRTVPIIHSVNQAVFVKIIELFNSALQYCSTHRR